MTAAVPPRTELVSPEAFSRSWERTEQPVIFVDATRGWPAASKWTFDWFRSKHGDVEIYVRSALYRRAAARGTSEPWGDARRMKLSAYVDEVLASTSRPVEEDLNRVADEMLGKRPEEINHMVGPTLLQAAPSLREDVRFPDYPPRWLRRFTESSSWIAGRGTFAQLHADRAHNVFTQIVGRKRWQLYSPRKSRRLRPLLLHWAAKISSLDLEVGGVRRAESEGLRPDYDFVLEPGEMLFIPVGWWHRVYTVEPSIAINLWWWSIPMTVRHGPGGASAFLRLKLLQALARS
jgi:hypothetical protein